MLLGAGYQSWFQGLPDGIPVTRIGLNVRIYLCLSIPD